MNNDSGGSADGASPGWVEVNLTFDTMRQLQSELAPHLSNDGLFIPCEDPFEPDTVVRFRISLSEDFVLIEGTGIVIWSREVGEESGAPGMAVRYASLSREAQETIDAVIDAHLASGGELFNFDPAGGEDGSFPTDALEPGVRGRGVDQADAREATARQLAQARVTIRDASAQDSAPAGSNGESQLTSSLEEDYLASVEAQVEEAVGWIRRDERGRAPAEQRAADSDQLPPSEPEQPMLEGFDLGSASVEESVGLGERPPSADIAGAPGLGSEPGDGELEVAQDTSDQQAAAGDAEASLERPESDVIESVIPVFLERWKQEIVTAAPDHAAEQMERQAPAATEAGDTDRGDAQRDRSAGVSVSDAEPAESPPRQFEVSVVDEAVESDETPVRGGALDRDEVILAPAESRGRPKRRWLLAAVVVAAVVVAGGGYLGWDWYRDRVGDRETPVIAERPIAAESAERAVAEQSAAVGSTEEVALEPEVEGPVPGAATVAPAELPAMPATAVESIAWRAESGETVVEIRGNGVMLEEAVSVFPMGDPPRILVRLSRIEEQYPEYEIQVGSPEVSRIRTGLHPELTPPALYVVLDLSGPRVGVADITIEGDAVRLTVATP